MKTDPVASLTNLPLSPAADQARRRRNYILAMSLRVICFICCFFSTGWVLFMFAVGAIVIPYIAVVLANATTAAPMLTSTYKPKALENK